MNQNKAIIVKILEKYEKKIPIYWPVHYNESIHYNAIKEMHQQIIDWLMVVVKKN